MVPDPPGALRLSRQHDGGALLEEGEARRGAAHGLGELDEDPGVGVHERRRAGQRVVSLIDSNGRECTMRNVDGADLVNNPKSN